MWSRELLKTRAKEEVLKKYYWLIFAACLIIGALEYFSSSISSSINSSFSSLSSLSAAIVPYDDSTLAVTLVAMIIIGTMLFVCGIALAGALALSAFVAGPLQVSMCRFLMETRQGKCDLSNLFWAFRRGRYMKIVRTMFFYTLYIFLWSLLFVIPGIIKYYEYYYVPYILSENPDINTDRVFELSTTMTNNEKFDIFVLELSFIGWQLVGLMACCIGVIFVKPYMLATYAELYAYVRERTIYRNVSDDAELPGFYVPPPIPLPYYGSPYQNMYQQQPPVPPDQPPADDPETPPPAEENPSSEE